MCSRTGRDSNTSTWHSPNARHFQDLGSCATRPTQIQLPGERAGVGHEGILAEPGWHAGNEIEW